MGVTNFRIDVATDTSGAATAYSNAPVQGAIEQIRYTPDAVSPLDTGADITITSEQTGLAIITITNIGTQPVTFAPRQATHDSAGAVVTYDATHGVKDKVVLAGERIKLVVAAGGNTLAGRFDVVVSKDD